MTNISLTIEDVLNKLQLSNDNNVGAFKCSKLSQDGIIVISNSMIYFTFQPGEKDDLKIEKFEYPLVQSIFIPQEGDNSPDVTLAGVLHKKYIEIKYGPLKIRFHFYQMQDFIKAEILLQNFLPDKIQSLEKLEPVSKKNVIQVSNSFEKKKDIKDNSETILEIDSVPNINILPNNARVSDEFLRVASNTVMNYHGFNLKSKEDSPEKQQKLNSIIAPVNIIDEKSPAEKNEEPGEVKGLVQANDITRTTIIKKDDLISMANDITRTTIIKKDELKNILNSRNDLNKIHQHARVSDKFLQVASDKMIRSEKIILKPSPPPSTFNWKKLLINIFYIFLIFLFFQTPYSKPVKTWIYKVYKQPDKISYIFNYLEIERCEVDMTSIGKIVMVDFKSNKSLPPDMEKYINKSFPDGKKNDHTKDPWGKPFSFEAQNNGFKIISSGPDKKKGTKDDIVKVFTIGYDPSKIN